jgi:hypothetical protein
MRTKNEQQKKLDNTMSPEMAKMVMQAKKAIREVIMSNKKRDENQRRKIDSEK